nr:helix-turn-helix transcriptional regulator [Kibdelosporangium sp. MJ126-NF4]CEL22102.1 Putative DNA-binding protein [Kibdelosporangium sp. MJ126-NF4]CTQ92883.1 Putative DNA-binding protein [Kibdelosporangium sp. MJ126-NF4]
MPNKRQPPRPRDRIIGARLRAIRRARTKFTLEAAAEVLGWGLATMSRIENGKRHISTEDVAMILTAYRIPSAEREEIIKEARAENASGWWDRPLPGVPAELGTLASYEADADSLTNWAVTLVPGLLQIEDYTMALCHSDGLSPDIAELYWVARRTRQKILGTVDYTAYISETVLRTRFGSPEAHRAQVKHLLNARERGILIRVVPEHLPVALVSHSWLYMTFPHTTPVANVEIATGGVFLHDEQAEPYAAWLTRLDHIALSTAATQTRLQVILKEV